MQSYRYPKILVNSTTSLEYDHIFMAHRWDKDYEQSPFLLGIEQAITPVTPPASRSDTPRTRASRLLSAKDDLCARSRD